MYCSIHSKTYQHGCTQKETFKTSSKLFQSISALGRELTCTPFLLLDYISPEMGPTRADTALPRAHLKMLSSLTHSSSGKLFNEVTCSLVPINTSSTPALSKNPIKLAASRGLCKIQNPMAEFTADMQSFAPSLPFLDIAPNTNMELINQYADQFNPTVLDFYSSLNFQTCMPFSNENYFSTQGPEFQGNLVQNFPNFVDHDNKSNQNDEAPAVQHLVGAGAGNGFQESKKRRAMDDVSESSSGISTPPVSETGVKRKNSSGRGKILKKSNEKEDEKPKDVVHVRARRGQATDSHSLAERVRRGKINERLRCLQNIVPGCSKTMGMAVMLDEIINYVQSLQNQVEFLSMKLTAASSFYDFNSETDDMETMQSAKVYEAAELERMKREGYGRYGSFHSTWPL